MSEIRFVGNTVEDKISKKALLSRIEVLEAEIEDLKRCKHEAEHDHTIAAEVVLTIAAYVKEEIARLLAPPQEMQAEQKAVSESEVNT